MAVRLVAQAASRDAAKNYQSVLQARGVTAGLEQESVVLTLSNESGCMPGCGVFHAATWAEVQTFAQWALDARVAVALAANPVYLIRDAQDARRELSAGELEQLAQKHSPGDHVVAHAVYFIGRRNAQLAEFRELAEEFVARVTGEKITGADTPENFFALARIAHARRESVREQELAGASRRVVELERELEVVRGRATVLAHTRNTAVRKLRRVRKAAKA